MLAGASRGLKTRERVVGFGTDSVNTTEVDVTSAGVGGRVTIQKITPQVEARHRRANSVARVSQCCGRTEGSLGFPLSWVVRRVATCIGRLAEYIRPDSELRPMDVITASLGGDIYSTSPQWIEPAVPDTRVNSLVNDTSMLMLDVDGNNWAIPDTAVTVKPIVPSVAERSQEGITVLKNRKVERKLKFMGYLAAHPVRLPVLGAEIAHEMKFKLLDMPNTQANERQVGLIVSDYIDGKIRASKEKGGDARFVDMRPQTKRLIQMYAVKLYFIPSPDEIAFHVMFQDPEIVAAMHWRSQLAAPTSA